MSGMLQFQTCTTVPSVWGSGLQPSCLCGNRLPMELLPQSDPVYGRGPGEKKVFSTAFVIVVLRVWFLCSGIQRGAF